MNLDFSLKLLSEERGYPLPRSDFGNGTFGTPVGRLRKVQRAFHSILVLPLALNLKFGPVLFPLRAFPSPCLELF